MNLLDLLDECGAMRRGLTHFKNGLVSDGWIEKGAIIRDPALLDQVAAVQAQAVAQAFPDATLLVGLPACGAVLASCVARHLGLPVAFALLHPHPAWHRMHVPQRGEQAVYVDDLICTGSDARAVLRFMRQENLRVLGVSAWLSRAELPGEHLITLAPAPFRNDAAHETPLQGPPAYTDVRE